MAARTKFVNRMAYYTSLDYKKSLEIMNELHTHTIVEII